MIQLEERSQLISLSSFDSPLVPAQLQNARVHRGRFDAVPCIVDAAGRLLSAG